MRIGKGVRKKEKEKRKKRVYDRKREGKDSWKK